MFSAVVSQPALNVETELQTAKSLMDQEKFAEAAPRFAALTEQSPRLTEAWFGLGYCLHMQGKYDEALPAHEEAAKLGGGWLLADALYNAACVHAVKGRTDQAFTTLNRAARAGMRDEPQLANDADLKSLRSDARWEQHLAYVRELKLNPPEKALHFWAGSWDRHVRGHHAVSAAALELRVDGAALHERRRSDHGSLGDGWSVYDADEGAWRQTWIGPGGRLTQLTGVSKDSGVWFEGVTSNASGEVERVTMFVRPVGDGRVRQTGGAYDESGTHVSHYDAVYVPAGQAFDASTFEWDEPTPRR